MREAMGLNLHRVAIVVYPARYTITVKNPARIASKDFKYINIPLKLETILRRNFMIKTVAHARGLPIIGFRCVRCTLERAI